MDPEHQLDEQITEVALKEIDLLIRRADHSKTFASFNLQMLHGMAAIDRDTLRMQCEMRLGNKARALEQERVDHRLPALSNGQAAVYRHVQGLLRANQVLQRARPA